MSDSHSDSWEENSVISEGFSDEITSSSDSDESGNTEPTEEVEIVRGAEPYRFEPLARPRRRDQDEADDDGHVAPAPDIANDRLQNTDWCSCGNCVVMEFVDNCKCCKEVEVIQQKIQQTGVEPGMINCFTEHPWYDATCLNPGTLQTAYFQYRQQYGRNAVEGDLARKYRHVSYRQVVRWCWGFLGRSNRVPLPSCIMHKVRTTYPDQDGNYKGFKYPDLDD